MGSANSVAYTECNEGNNGYRFTSCIERVKRDLSLFWRNAGGSKRNHQGWFLPGIGGVITYKNAGLDKVIKEIDLRHLVLETDAPYLAPVPFRGKRNESSYLGAIVEKLSEVKGIPLKK
jgi:TatD DNase family protein